MEKKISLEDVILYAMGLGLFVFFGYYFTTTTSKIADKIGNIGIDSSPSRLTYDFAQEVLISNSNRTNMSFMVGSIMVTLGAMIIIRRVRNETNSISAGSSSFKFDLNTNSPGIILSFLGTIIICFSIFFKDKYDMNSGLERTHTQEQTFTPGELKPIDLDKIHKDLKP